MRWKNSTEVGCSPSTFISTSDGVGAGLADIQEICRERLSSASRAQEDAVQVREDTASARRTAARPANCAPCGARILPARQVAREQHAVRLIAHANSRQRAAAGDVLGEERARQARGGRA